MSEPPARRQAGEYWERQRGAWCGMHALNNYAGGPYVTEDACRAAARGVAARTGGNVAAHLDPQSGWLSVDVMNVLGAAQLGIHVDGAPVGWAEMQEAADACVVNWANTHWTVLVRERAGASVWVHVNSIAGSGASAGRRAGLEIWRRNPVPWD